MDLQCTNNDKQPESGFKTPISLIERPEFSSPLSSGYSSSQETESSQVASSPVVALASIPIPLSSSPALASSIGSSSATITTSSSNTSNGTSPILVASTVQELQRKKLQYFHFNLH